MCIGQMFQVELLHVWLQYSGKYQRGTERLAVWPAETQSS